MPAPVFVQGEEKWLYSAEEAAGRGSRGERPVSLAAPLPDSLYSGRQQGAVRGERGLHDLE